MEEARSRTSSGPDKGAARLRADPPPHALPLSTAARTHSGSVISGPGPPVPVKERGRLARAHAGGCAAVPGLVGEPLCLLPAAPTPVLRSILSGQDLGTHLS